MNKQQLSEKIHELEQKLLEEQMKAAKLVDQVTSRSWYQPFFYGLGTGITITTIVILLIK